MGGALGRWHVSYTPGAWLTLCGPSSAVVLEPADASWSDLVESLWGEVLAADSITDVAARLATYRVDDMPSFAAFFWGPGGMRSLVRGEVRVVDADSDQVVASGEGVQTWTEVGLGGTTRVRVELPADRDPSAYALPMVVGVAGVSSVLLNASDEARLTSPQGWGDEPGERENPADLEDTDELDDTSGESTQLVDAFAEEDEHDNASTALMDVPPALPPELEAPSPDAAVPNGPSVTAVFCGWGHPNPPGASVCRVCQGQIGEQQPREVAPPVLAVLRTSSGDSVELDHAVLVGRAPSADRSATEGPELLTVSSPSHDISRTHLEVRPAEWDVVVTDLHSTNGTVLLAPDGSARQLDPGESVTVALGTAIELAEGVSVLVDYPQ